SGGRTVTGTRRRRRSSADSRTVSGATTARRSCRRRQSTSRKASSGVRSRFRSPSGIRRSSGCATSPTSTRPGIGCAWTSTRIAIAPRPVPRFSRGTAVGAGVVGGKNDEGIPLMLHLASRGGVGVSADYRLSPRATFPEPLIDLKHALRWIREQGPAYGVDPDFVVVTGGSAGGHLAALVA